MDVPPESASEGPNDSLQAARILAVQSHAARCMAVCARGGPAGLIQRFARGLRCTPRNPVPVRWWGAVFPGRCRWWGRCV